MSLSTFAFGVALHFAATEDGGRRTPLSGGSDPKDRFTYRPNWGLPGMTPPEQTGAPVLAFSHVDVAPGDSVRVVIVPPFPEMVPLWSQVQPGTELPCYEGKRVVGHGRVLWRQATALPLPDADDTRFTRWVLAPDESPDPPQ